MGAALALSERARGRTAPNPNVGCVLVRDGVVVGRGWTQPGGRPHAEAMALAEAGEKSRGATSYVTLEPCAHVSPRGPACSDLLVAAGVALALLVVAGCKGGGGVGLGAPALVGGVEQREIPLNRRRSAVDGDDEAGHLVELADQEPRDHHAGQGQRAWLRLYRGGTSHHPGGGPRGRLPPLRGRIRGLIRKKTDKIVDIKESKLWTAFKCA